MERYGYHIEPYLVTVGEHAGKWDVRVKWVVFDEGSNGPKEQTWTLGVFCNDEQAARDAALRWIQEEHEPRPERPQPRIWTEGEHRVDCAGKQAVESGLRKEPVDWEQPLKWGNAIEYRCVDSECSFAVWSLSSQIDDLLRAASLTRWSV